jgi:hypothetical protein
MAHFGAGAQKFAFGFGGAELFSRSNNFPKRFELIALLVSQQRRITDNVDEQDTPDLKFSV